MPIARRSRMHRVTSPKPLALTKRDIEVLRCLERYRYLRSTYLHAFAGGAEKRFIERLCELFHGGLIARPALQWQFADARCQPLVHERVPQARRLLTTGDDTGPRTYLGSNAHRQFLHALSVCGCLASIELAAATRDDLRFIPWSEILGRVPEPARTSAAPFRLAAGADTIVPDGLFGIEYRSGTRKAYRFFALELDRGTMPVTRARGTMTSIAGKLASYARFISAGGPSSVLGIPNLFVLTLTPGNARMANAAAAASSSHCAPWFLFKVLDESALRRPLPSLMTDAWGRGGLPALSIAQAE
jgi:hypothetical protein